MDPMELLKLLGILIVVVGFALRLNSILIIMAAAITTAIVAGMPVEAFLTAMGKSFISNRSMCIFVMIMVLTGTLERNGLKKAAANVMSRFKRASAGMVLGIYGVFRVVFAAFNVSFGGVAGFVRPVVMPMAQAAADKGNKEKGLPAAGEERVEELKGMAAGMENVAWFFGQVLFVGGSGGLLVQGTLKELGYDVQLIDLAGIQIPVALVAVVAASLYYILLDRRLAAKEAGAKGAAKVGEN